MDIILARVAPTLGATSAAIFLADPGEQQGALYFKSIGDEKAESLMTLKPKPGQGIVGHVARTGQIVRVAHAADHPAHDPTHQPAGSTSGPTRCSACRSPWTRRWSARSRC